ncbi:MAG: excinuclease ABC subunit UvrA [Bacteroidales bacterium]|nr:excinuclease ABC subunit UvrA [Bacteroidales bacterium]MDT8430022.1 excinuclease ABC subunit UvrA [Bacteroidales bacterium]
MPTNSDQEIFVKGARVHNLKNIDIAIPRDQLVVVTGVSGSGKSSLAFDTLYAEGQRRYVESLSAYARQFLGRLDKPDVDYIHGIPPAVAIEQKVNTRNPRSTVGTSTEIYDYLKLLYARIGKTISPVSGGEVKKHSVTDVVDSILEFEDGKKLVILATVCLQTGTDFNYQLEILAQQGMTRALQDNRMIGVEELAGDTAFLKSGIVRLVIDRIVVSREEENISRIGDSVQTAFQVGHGYCRIWDPDKEASLDFSTRFERDGISFEEPTEHLFSFNNPLGACPVCEGYGMVIGIDEDLVVPNKELSVYDDAIVCWKGEKMKRWKEKLIMHADAFDFPIHQPFYQLTDAQRRLVWTGNRYFKGLDKFFEHLENKKYKIQYRVMLSRYRGKTTCHECGGSRLRKEALYVKIHDRTIAELVQMPVSGLLAFFKGFKPGSHEKEIAGRLISELCSRLRFLNNVGLTYLTLNRLSSTLSGGESQRINLATSLGSSLVGSLYILDEPSIGLHPRDTGRLIEVLKELKELGNTVLVVEHDEEIMNAADMIIDMGPAAGRHGGEVVFQGNHRELMAAPRGLTAAYLCGSRMIALPEQRRKWNNYLEVLGCRENNLKSVDIRVPLQVMTVISGVSGSGKSSFVKDILFPVLARKLNGAGEKPGKHDLFRGDVHLLDRVEFVDQNPIGRSSRSNPVTYLKAYDEIRKLFADQQASKNQGFKASHFSFNVDGGRCEECKGEGEILVEMQFMADVHLVCEQCGGRRFRDEILDVRYMGRNIYDVLEMTVNEAIEFFGEEGSGTPARIVRKLKPLQDVGLGYIKLGQSSSTLSGGESQRVKLAFFLSKESEDEKVIFIFDEPTTGLHFHDISMLLAAFNALIFKGHTVLIIEHNLEVIKSADWIIELGPEGGDGGGEVIFEGTPEAIIREKGSPTGRYLEHKIK